MDGTTPSHDERSQPPQAPLCDATPDNDRMPTLLAASAHANLAAPNSPISEWLSTLSLEPNDRPSRGRHSRDHKPADD